MRIIPAIDIIDGKCVRLTQGDYSTKRIYNEDPLEIARSFETYGIQYLHLVDLDGARLKHVVNYSVPEKICSKTKLKVDFGGGIRSDQDIRIAFESGVHQVTGGSVALNAPGLFKKWLSVYGTEKIILGADSLNGKIAINGWAEYVETTVLNFIKNYEHTGIQYVICTDIKKDGMLRGPSFNLYKEIIAQTHVKLIASGGISSVNDLLELKGLGCEGAIIGKALYENKITLKELSKLC